MAEKRKVGFYLDADAVDLLAEMAPGYTKGDFVSQLIREEAARRQGQPVQQQSSADAAYARIGRQVVGLARELVASLPEEGTQDE